MEVTANAGTAAPSSAPVEPQGNSYDQVPEANESDSEGSYEEQLRKEGLIKSRGNTNPDEQESEEPQKQDLSNQRFKVKINGESKDVSLQELLRGYSHATAANEKFQKAKEIMKEHDSMRTDVLKIVDMFDRIRKDPTQLLELGRHLGIDEERLSDVTHNDVLRQVKWAGMSDEQKELHELRQKQKAWQEHEEKQKALEQEKLRQATFQKAEEELDNSLAQFFARNNITPTRELLRRVAYEMDMAYDVYGRAISVNQAYQRIMQYDADYRRRVYEEDIKAGKVPDEVRSIFRKADVETLKQPFRSKPPTSPADRVQSNGPKRRKTFTEFFEEQEKFFNPR